MELREQRFGIEIEDRDHKGRGGQGSRHIFWDKVGICGHLLPDICSRGSGGTTVEIHE